MFAPAYLDHNATTPLDERVREAMLPYLGVRFGNASSRHEYGRQARAAIDHARGQVAAAVNAHPSEVVFVSGGSEANNLFLRGAAARLQPGTIVIGGGEHPCVREPARALSRSGWALRSLRLRPDGRLDQADFKAAMRGAPTLVSVMSAHNETGVIEDVGALATEARSAGALFHTDAVQAFGKLAVDFRASGVNAMTLSSHKIGGPQGAGALVIDKRVDLMPQIAGGGQERGLRSGTENLAAIVGFGRAAELVTAEREAARTRLLALRGRVEAAVLAQGGVVFGGTAPRLPNTLFFALDALDGETLVARLDRAGFAVASGSACSSASPEPSATLLAMGVAPELARCAVRVSLGYGTTDDEIGRFVVALGETINSLRQMTAVSA